MRTHVTALFADRHSAHAALEQLVQAGFPRDAISLAMTEDTHEREFGSPSPDRSGIRSARSGGVLLAIVAGLMAFAWPGAARLRVGGPLAAAITRTTALPAALLASGFAEEQVRAVHEGLRQGAIVVGVQAEGDRARTATQLLELSGGALLQAA